MEIYLGIIHDSVAARHDPITLLLPGFSGSPASVRLD
jgi:hypothetical protein